MGIQKIIPAKRPVNLTGKDAAQVHTVLEQIKQNKEGLEFLKTGFDNIDAFLDGGFLRKELIVVGAHTGVGKSYFAGQLMMNIAKQGFRCAYFSLEISNEMVVARMLGAMSNIKPTRIRMGYLTAEEFSAKTKAEMELESLNEMLYFYDIIYNLDEIIALIKAHTYDFVVVDFIQNVMTSEGDEYARLSRVALTLQECAKETNSTILVLSQLSNAIAKEGSKGKVLEYKGSGSIATVCDLGFFIERGEGSDFSNGASNVKLSLRKNRRGISGQEWTLSFKIPGGHIYESYTQT
jgi:replicative DNA helicase